MRIRIFIAIMVAAIMLPLLLASGFAVNKIWQEEHAAAIATLRKTAEATSLMVDRDIQASVAALYALGNSEHLLAGNYEAFYAQAKAINRVPDTWTALLRSDSSQVLNTATPFATPVWVPPPPAPSPPAAQVLAAQKPLVSDVFVGPRTGRQLIAVYVPAVAPSAEKYVVAQGFALEQWKDIGKQPGLPADWIIAVVDRAGRIVARSHMSDELRGKPARPELVAAAAHKNEGMYRNLTLEGIDSYVAFDHSEVTGWTIAVAAPVTLINGPVLRAVQIAVAGFILAMLASALLATLFARRFVAALQSASEAAISLGHGQTPKATRTAIAEVNHLNQSLANAGELLERERLARLAAEVERERLLEVERLAHDAAEKENKAKDQFLAMLGHELRNPLAAISGAVAVLTRGTKSTLDAAHSDRYLGIIRRQNRHLVHIIDDLLDMSRLIAGKIVLERHAVDLAECLHSCVDGLRAADRVGGHGLNVTAQPVWVNADPVRIEQILINLIGNALKFSKTGTTIEVDLHQVGDTAVMTVQDNGSGMVPELLAQVFEPFVQGPPPVSGTQSGMGIGLALVKQLIELHDGTVTVASTGPNQGSTFTVHFPAVPAPTCDPASGFAHLVAARPRTLLYVEDNADARAVMSEMLRLSGYNVTEAADGAQALAAVALGQPDAILLDIGLPDMNGYEVARQIRQLANGHSVPIIALTGYGQPRDKDAAAQIGFSAHLVKPVEPEDLTRTVEAALGSPMQQRWP